ncbi:LCP family protein [Saccharothrix obliqua]|uniref:LCP family protein n=1 Tax=Saccharothrix obliqua TaxID=2861747 RepID=UPI001C5F9C3D|nr:LCP family protein [Saccharothrix obliqua]MBW4718073.1 LCP family protein [Saccharothrix obliqua]
MTDQEQLIREALAAEAAEAADTRDVLAALYRGRARRRRPLALIAAAAVTTAAAAVAVVVPLTAGHTAAPPVEAGTSSGPRNVLLVGVDDGGRADTVMLAHVGGPNGIAVVSLPRDTRVDVPGRGPVNLASTYSTEDRVQGLKNAVESLTGVRVDHHAAVETRAFGALADAVGGVEVCLKAAVDDPFSGASLPAGRQELNGEQALAFLRQRRGLPRGDLDRVVRQQAFLRAASAKVLDRSVLGDPAKLAALVDVARAGVRTDEGWDLLAFARDLTPGTAVRAATIPVGDTPEIEDGKPLLAVDPAEVRRFYAGFTAGQATGGGTPTGTPAGDDCVD